jgi:CDP-diacylglycerol--serine O-phosphatidyltransferase
VTVSGVALLMVSRVPTVSLKGIRIAHDMVVPTLLAVGVAAAALTTAPWPTLTLVGLVYLGSIPATVRTYYRLRRAAEPRRNAMNRAPALGPPDAAANGLAAERPTRDEPQS